MRRADLTLAAIFGVPLMVGVAGLIGLVGALIGEGPWNAIGAVLLAAPCATVVWARLPRGPGT